MGVESNSVTKTRELWGSPGKPSCRTNGRQATALPERNPVSWPSNVLLGSSLENAINSFSWSRCLYGCPWSLATAPLALHGQLRGSPPFLSNPGSRCPPLLWSLCSHTNEGRCLYPNLPHQPADPPVAGILSNSPRWSQDSNCPKALDKWLQTVFHYFKRD